MKDIIMNSKIHYHPSSSVTRGAAAPIGPKKKRGKKRAFSALTRFVCSDRGL